MAGATAERYLIRCLTGAVFKTCDFSSIHVPGAIELPGGSFSLGAGSVVAIRNRLLAALPPTDLGMLTPHFQKVMFGPNAVLVRSGTELDEGRRTGRICLVALAPKFAARRVPFTSDSQRAQALLQHVDESSHLATQDRRGRLPTYRTGEGRKSAKPRRVGCSPSYSTFDTNPNTMSTGPSRTILQSI